MLVLHGFWAARDGLCLWAEDSERAGQQRQPGAPVRPGRTRSPRPRATLAALHAGKPGRGGPAAAVAAHGSA